MAKPIHIVDPIIAFNKIYKTISIEGFAKPNPSTKLRVDIKVRLEAIDGWEVLEDYGTWSIMLRHDRTYHLEVKGGLAEPLRRAREEWSKLSLEIN